VPAAESAQRQFYLYGQQRLYTEAQHRFRTHPKPSQVYVSSDRNNWGGPCAAGTFQKGRSDKNILFEKASTGRFVRLVGLSGFDGQAFASIAELNIIPASVK